MPSDKSESYAKATRLLSTRYEGICELKAVLDGMKPDTNVCMKSGELDYGSKNVEDVRPGRALLRGLARRVMKNTFEKNEAPEGAPFLTCSTKRLELEAHPDAHVEG
jgi:hypothetical protein